MEREGYTHDGTEAADRDVEIPVSENYHLPSELKRKEEKKVGLAKLLADRKRKEEERRSGVKRARPTLFQHDEKEDDEGEEEGSDEEEVDDEPAAKRRRLEEEIAAKRRREKEQLQREAEELAEREAKSAELDLPCYRDDFIVEDEKYGYGNKRNGEKSFVWDGLKQVKLIDLATEPKPEPKRATLPPLPDDAPPSPPRDLKRSGPIATALPLAPVTRTRQTGPVAARSGGTEPRSDPRSRGSSRFLTPSHHDQPS